jgi:hypothetical protein
MKEYIKLLVAPCSIFYFNFGNTVISFFFLGQQGNPAGKVPAQAVHGVRQFINNIQSKLATTAACKIIIRSTSTMT